MNAHAETHRTHTTDARRAGDTLRRLVVVRRGTRLFGVYADEIEASCVTDDFTPGDTHDRAPDFSFPESSAPPAPLPGAPRAVRGVVVVRGRVYTLIDPALLFDERIDVAPDASDESDARSIVVPLRGDEQLAIEAGRIEATIVIAAADIAPATLPGVEGIAAENIHVLDTRALFAAATRGMERRRRRT